MSPPAGHDPAAPPSGAPVEAPGGGAVLTVYNPKGDDANQDFIGTPRDFGSGATDGYRFHVETAGWNPGDYTASVVYAAPAASPPSRRPPTPASQ